MAMSRLPRIAADGRGLGIAKVAALAVGQAVAAGLAAFAMRDVFAALRDASAPLPVFALGQIAAAGLVIAWLRVTERVAAERIGQQYAGALRLRLFAHLARMSERAVGGRRAGALAMRFVGDLAAVRNWVSLGIARLISAGVVLPAATGVLFLLEPRLALAASVPIVLGLAAMALAGPRLGPAHRRLRSRRARLAADMLERVPHAPELRLLGRLDIETARVMRRTEALIESALARASGAATLRALPDLVSGVAAAALLLAAFRSGIPASEAAGAMAALGLMIHPMRDLAGVWDRWRAWTIARDKCASLLAAPTLDRRRRDARSTPLADRPPRLCFAGVAAGALCGLDIEALPRQKIAIVGGNGAGKSTLLLLAAGLEQPHRGKVTLDGREPRDLSAGERRRMIALMSPRSPILAGSLRRALTMGSSRRCPDAEIAARACAFGLGDLLQRLGGLDGTLAEGGRNLSAGEARRVLLTRAALSGARLLLLDEPDDALDADGADLVEAFVRAADATVLLVTHGLALARRMDLLWFVDQGRVIEAGKPDVLLRGDGPTARHFKPRSAA
jgi:ABC-type multidrug transport system fused ATPase/permease subunit